MPEREGPGRRAEYCSRRCRQAAKYERDVGRRVEVWSPGPRVCAVCGEEFHAAMSDHRYCSVSCRRREERRRRQSQIKGSTNGYRTLFILERGGCCARCGSVLAVDLLEVHHVVPVASGGQHEPSNVLVLCKPCHRAVHEETPTPRKDGSPVLAVKSKEPRGPVAERKILEGMARTKEALESTPIVFGRYGGVGGRPPVQKVAKRKKK